MVSRSTKIGSGIVTNPEIFIGLVGPIGVDLSPVQECIISELKTLGYQTEFIKITDLMREWAIDGASISDNSFSDYYKDLIEFADKFRRRCKSHSALAALAIGEIRKRRLQIQRTIPDNKNKTDNKLEEEPALGTAYLVRQFKLPQETELMRLTYGRKFIQISVFVSQEERKKFLVKSIQNFKPKRLKNSTAETQAIELMEIDSNEESEEYGQRITNVFHLGDVFVRGNSRENINTTTSRFFRAFFGSNHISPSKMEYGMYAAAAAALRSVDLSRQVGAAIFSQSGEIKTMGCNEVPKAFGGTYWEDDGGQQHRDIEELLYANHSRKIEILHDFITRMKNLNLIKAGNNKINNTDDLVNYLSSNELIKDSQLMDIIEFGRMVHAEMNAITDAARLGKSIHNCTLFCTTFPCHMCAKHIVSSGIRRVVFLEPYPKSYAEELHSDSITFSTFDSDNKVFFEPFIGISPRRYRDIFEKKKRKTISGSIRPWNEGDPEPVPIPRIDDKSPSYIENEVPAMAYGGLKNLHLTA